MAKRKHSTDERTFDARPDSLDFRDRMFVPTLVEVPADRPLSLYLQSKPPILNQGQEGACTGFGLAALCNYLLRTRSRGADSTPVSARMLYEMAKRYDEWRGENYEGSSARGAMKGWHKHGVCSDALWKHVAGARDARLSEVRARDAAQRPLGAYFRVNHQDLVAMHAALAEVGILFATASVHSGWQSVGRSGRIAFEKRKIGGHAFAIVAYDENGFWIQNSWGRGWGKSGFAHLGYDDWLENGMDVWVARLGAPVRVADSPVIPGQRTSLALSGLSFGDVRPHVVSIGNDGVLRDSGQYGNDADDIAEIFDETLPRITRDWRKKRILLYAHGGLVSEKSALQRVENYVQALRSREVYPIAFVWKTDFWATIGNVLSDALGRRRAEGVLDATKDFMLDRLDDALEPVARHLSGKLQWDEIKENALCATTGRNGGARLVAEHLARLAASDPKVEIHVAAHSAGGIFMAPLVQLLAADGRIERGPLKGEEGLGLKIATCTLWAPACTLELFDETYRPVIDERGITSFALFNLNERKEQDDHCAHIYNKSLLYLVSNALERTARIPLFRDGEPLLGMDRYVSASSALKKLFRRRFADYVKSPNANPPGDKDAARADRHNDFDDDPATVKATLTRILGGKAVRDSIEFPPSEDSTRARRRRVSERG